MFFNFDPVEKELDHQLQIFTSIEKMRVKDKEEYLGLIFPFYEYEYDLGAYGLIGKNGTSVVLIKKLDYTNSKEQDNKINILLKQIYKFYSEYVMNPFYEENISNDKSKKDDDTLKVQFINKIQKEINISQL
ncbi:MAG: hypothetical protein MJ252_14535 [archaeon]|nr:hypothetical protein [archaeon]